MVTTYNTLLTYNVDTRDPIGSKNSDKTVEVKCVDDEEKPVTDPPAPPVPGDEGVVLALKIGRFGIY